MRVILAGRAPIGTVGAESRLAGAIALSASVFSTLQFEQWGSEPDRVRRYAVSIAIIGSTDKGMVQTAPDNFPLPDNINMIGSAFFSPKVCGFNNE